MPDFTYSTALTANVRDQRPLANWQFRRLPYDAQVTVLQRATTAGVQTTIFAGSQTALQRSQTQGGGTAGVTPSPLNTPAWQFIADAGDELIISNDETLAGTPTVDGWVNVEPI
jgi:hypothetical protein